MHKSHAADPDPAPQPPDARISVLARTTTRMPLPQPLRYLPHSHRHIHNARCGPCWALGLVVIRASDGRACASGDGWQQHAWETRRRTYIDAVYTRERNYDASCCVKELDEYSNLRSESRGEGVGTRVITSGKMSATGPRTSSRSLGGRAIGYVCSQMAGRAVGQKMGNMRKRRRLMVGFLVVSLQYQWHLETSELSCSISAPVPLRLG